MTMTVNALPYTMTVDSLTVIFEGHSYVISKDAPQYRTLCDAIQKNDWLTVTENFTVAQNIQRWAQGRFTVKDNCFYLDEAQLPIELNERILQMATAGANPTAILNFWERLQRNPSMRSVTQLWSFLQHEGIPLTEDGCFLAYKGVKENFTDAHTGKLLNTPGAVHEMPRNKISDDPNQACHVGFHVGALAYATTFSSRVVICKVDPEHVVCVPYDASQHKMRVCKYEVIGQHNGSLLPSTFASVDVVSLEGKVGDVPVDEEEYPEDKEFDEKQAIAAVLEQERADFAVFVAKYTLMNFMELLSEDKSQLQRYARDVLKVVDVERIPGGKIGLVVVILRARR